MGIFEGYLLVSDMDGTLFDDNKEVSAENKAAIDRFMAGGGKFTVATGRMRLAVERYFSEITINAPAIMHNGALVYDFEKDKVISKKFIERDRKEIYKRIYNDRPDLGIEVYTADEHVYVYRNSVQSERFKNNIYPVSYSMPESVWDEDWLKILLLGDKKLLDDFEPIFRSKYDSGYAVRSGEDFFDIMANGVSKGIGVDKTAEYLGISQDKVITVGDNMNDLSMLENRKLSFAVANAEDAAKRAAAMEAPDNNSAPIAYIINKLERDFIN